jgi:predicted  nucleic acid-binding Zn-ribbon protein
MEELLDILVKLQEYDSEVKITRSRIEEIPNRIAALEEEINSAEERVKEKEKRVHDIRKEYKLKEGDISDNETKIHKLNTQTSAVKTNEEYRALISEVEFLKKENKKIEDEMIGLLEEEEQLKKTLGAFTEETNAIISEKKKKIDELESERATLSAQLETAQRNYETYFGKLTPDLKDLYKKISKVRGNAVSIIVDETCTGCSSILTPQLFNELKKRNNIILCDNCGRILVYAPHHST